MEINIHLPPNTHINFIDYEIEIPLLGIRGIKVIEFLEKNNLADKIFKERLAHDQDFINRIYQEPDQEILKTF